MPKASEPQREPARRALIEDIRADKKGWLQHGIAALAVSLLGLGVAGSIALTGAAQESDGTLATTQAGTAERDAEQTSRDTARPELDAAKIKSLADQRAEELSKTDAETDEKAMDQAAAAREKSLRSQSKKTQEQAKKLASGQSAASNSGTAATEEPVEVKNDGKSCLPINGGYSVAARFGQVGSWSRYHTGYDFSDPVGTPLHASAAGVVTNAGIGPASGWAGNYVVVKHADGSQTLLAHMSTVSVKVGQTVSGCQVVGAIGMTGRTFGPHVHFEVYPAGITPGDVYKAINPLGWLNSHGLKP